VALACDVGVIAAPAHGDVGELGPALACPVGQALASEVFIDSGCLAIWMAIMPGPAGCPPRRGGQP
jgi:hypothetical protein